MNAQAPGPVSVIEILPLSYEIKPAVSKELSLFVPSDVSRAVKRHSALGDSFQSVKTEHNQEAGEDNAVP